MFWSVLGALAFNEAVVKPILNKPSQQPLPLKKDSCEVYNYNSIAEKLPLFLFFELPFIYMQPFYFGGSLAYVMAGNFWALIPLIISFFGTIFCFSWLLFVTSNIK